MNRFCKAEGCGDFDLSDDNIICSTKIKIKEEIGIEGLIEEGLDFIARKEKKHGKERNLFSRYVMSDTEEYSTTDNTEGYSVSANTGTYSAATNTGESSLAVNAGYYSVAKNKGNYSVAANTGDCSASVNMGFHSAATNKGISSVSLNMGAFSAAVNEGDFSVSLSTGVESSAVAKGKQSFAIAIGHESKAKGSLGSWIVLTECEEYNGEVYPVKEAKIFKVDGEKIKPDTYYKLVNGEAVEA